MDKSPDAFRTISEVADDLDLPQHVLRFWETRFTQIKPLKRGGGRRYYRPEDVDLLKGIRQLLYGRGYTIKGVQRILKEDGIRFVQSLGRGEHGVSVGPPSPADEDDEASEAPVTLSELTPRERSATDTSRTQAGPAALSGHDLAALRRALDDLVECERVLASLKAGEEPLTG